MSNNNSASALASLTATYTDSENEDGAPMDDSLDEDSIASDASENFRSEVYTTPTKTQEKKKKSSRSIRRLVSYHDDTVISENESENSDTSEEPIVDENKNLGEPELTQKESIDQKYAHYGFSLPSEARTKPSHELVEKIKNLFVKKETANMDMNKIIQERKEFRNPSIYEKLIQFCDINEFGTNYPPEIYDPLKWGPESYYEELAKTQKAEMAKRQKERKDTDKIEQATAAARKVEEEAKKRKSKWDQPAITKKPNAQALTTTVTGTKGTVISAFGSLPKKSNQ